MYSLQRKYFVNPITFNEEEEVTCPHKNHLVVTLRVGLCDIFHILVDTESLIYHVRPRNNQFSHNGEKDYHDGKLCGS